MTCRRARRAPRRPRLVAALSVARVALWFAVRPRVGLRTFLGQLAGAQAVLLLSTGLVLVSTLPWVERWFDGIDRAAIWHRRVAITGMLLLAPHAALAANPSPSTIGPGLAGVATAGLLALVVWSVLPRWRSVLPPAAAPGRRPRATRPASRLLRGSSAGTSAGAASTG